MSDHDRDGVLDQQDLDSDNDGLPDVVEAGSQDNDRDGLFDRFRDLDANGLADQLRAFPIEIQDSDNDNTANYIDFDSDNDGLTDRFETAGVDTDFDGQIDDFRDINVDGLDDRYNGVRDLIVDTDSDSLPDYLDPDSDNDGLGDADEAIGFVAMSNAEQTEFNQEVQSIGADASEGTRPEQIVLITGESGGFFGCAVSSLKHDGNKGNTDPLFILLILTALLILMKKTLLPGKAGFGRLALIRCLMTIVIGGQLTSCVNVASNSAGANIQPYVGVGVGASFLNADTSGTDLEQDRDISAAAQLTLGSQFSPYFAVEGRLADLGEATFTNGQAVGYQIADASALAQFSKNRLQGFARLGVGILNNDGDIATEQLNRFHLVLGAGAAYSLTRGWSVRAEWMGHDVDVAHGQLSLLYRFGRSSSPPPPRVLVEDRQQNTVEPNIIAATPAQPEPAVAPAAPLASTAPVEPVLSAVPAANSNPIGSNASIESTVASSTRPAVPNSTLAVEPANPPPTRSIEIPQPVAAPGSLQEIESTVATQTELIVEPEPEPQNELAAAITSADAVEIVEPGDVNAPNSIGPDTQTQLALATPSDSIARLQITPVPQNRPDSRLRPLILEPIDTNPEKIAQLGTVDASVSCESLPAGTPVSADGCALFGGPVPKLTFGDDTAELTSSAEEVLDEMVLALNDDKEISLTVATHTGASGDSQSAMFLSRQRTLSIIRYLSENGIDTSRLKPEAYGDTVPLKGTANQGDNDRVEIYIR